MTTRFAWCFDHGTLHRFFGETWCSAAWASLAGDTETEALVDKQTRYGDARFIDQLPLEEQLELINSQQECQ